jgi:hypothetical protein
MRYNLRGKAIASLFSALGASEKYEKYIEIYMPLFTAYKVGTSQLCARIFYCNAYRTTGSRCILLVPSIAPQVGCKMLSTWNNYLIFLTLCNCKIRGATECCLSVFNIADNVCKEVG